MWVSKKELSAQINMTRDHDVLSRRRVVYQKGKSEVTRK